MLDLTFTRVSVRNLKASHRAPWFGPGHRHSGVSDVPEQEVSWGLGTCADMPGERMSNGQMLDS